MGYVPGAVRCNPFGVKGPSTQFGTWYVDPQTVEGLLADRRAGAGPCRGTASRCWTTCA